MSWGTSFLADICIFRQIIKTKQEALMQKEELELELQECSKYIFGLVMATPNDVTPHDEESLLYLTRVLNEALEEINSINVRLYQINLLLQSFDDEEFKPIIE